jgi:uncharacterized membrane protein YhaH (DUF805 family)
MGFWPYVLMAAAIGMTARIAQKAGFSGWWGLTQIVPLVGLVMMWVLAFIDWPATRPPRGEEDERFLPPPE